MKAITPEQMTTLINSSYNKIPIVNKNSPGIILPPPKSSIRVGENIRNKK